MSFLLICAILGACGQDLLAPRLTEVDVLAEARTARPSTVTDLTVISTTDRSATLRFSAASDGLGGTPSYEIRYATDGGRWSWSRARTATLGSCASPVAGIPGAASLTCTVEGLVPTTAYAFQLEAFRGQWGVDAVYGYPSNLAKGRTAATPPPVTAVVATPATLGLTSLGEVATVTAEARDAAGNVIAQAPLVWAVADTGVALVDATGRVTARTSGSTVVVVSAGCCAVADTVPVTVAQPVASSLPSGLARECDSLQGAWIWCDDFETDRTGRYFEYTRPTSFTRDAAVGVAGSSGMRAHFTAGLVDAGNLKLAFGRTPSSYFRPVDAGTANYREIYWRVFVRNDPAWTGGGGNKLSRATVFAGSNWSQAAIGHVWSGGPGANALVLDPASGTDAAGNVVTTQYNDFANLTFLGQGVGATPLFDAAHVGAWHCVEAHMRLNRAGLADGLFELFVDGKLDAAKTGLSWLGAYDAYGINSLLLENYWNAGSPVDQSRYFDNLVVSTQPIGCGDGTTAPATAVTLEAVSMTPGTVELAPGQTNRFVVSGRYSDAHTADLTTEAVFGGTTGGSVASDGLYTAGITPGTYRLDATVEGLATSASIVIDAPPAQISHEPSGFTPLVERRFDTKATADGDRGTGSFPNKVGGSEGWDGVEYRMANLTVVPASDDPLSPGSAMRFTYPVGLTANTGPGVAQTQGLGGRRDLYTRTSIRLGPTYWVGSVANKLFFHREDGTSPGEPFLALRKKATDPDSFELVANFQGTPDNGAGFYAAKGAGASIGRSRWYVIETLLLMSSGPDRRDGVFRVWVDGSLVLERTDVAYYGSAGGSGTFGTLHVSPTFGGSSGAPNPTQFYWEMGHAYVSGR